MTKIRKLDLKKLIKECIVEIVREDPRIGKMIVKEAIIDMFGKRMLLDVSQQRRPAQANKRRPKRTNIPAMVQGKRPVSEQEELEEPENLFEQIAADTMMNTMPDQITSDQSAKKKSRSWAEMAGDDGIMDDGPLSHLRAAAMQPDPNHDRRIAMQQSTPQAPVQQPMMHDQPVIGEPSQSQIEQMYKLQQTQSDSPASQAAAVPVESVIPDDLAAIGLGNKNWGAHF